MSRADHEQAADPVYDKVGRHRFEYGQIYKYIVKYTGRNCASSHPTVTRRLFDVMQFREGYVHRSHGPRCFVQPLVCRASCM